MISELELHTIKARLHAGLINKARRGELALSLPVGLVRDLPAAWSSSTLTRRCGSGSTFVFATFLRVKSIHGVVRETGGRPAAASCAASADATTAPSCGGVRRRRRSRACSATRPTPARSFTAGRGSCRVCPAGLPQAPVAPGAMAVHGPRQVPRLHRPRDLRHHPGDPPRQLPGVQPSPEPRRGTVRVAPCSRAWPTAATAAAR